MLRMGGVIRLSVVSVSQNYDNMVDNKMNVKNIFVISFVALYIAGCTWIDVSLQGEQVKVLTAQDIVSCKHVGKTTVKTAAKLVGLERHTHKVQVELNTLARNSAVEIGGDAVVAIGSPKQGHQVFDVYSCSP